MPRRESGPEPAVAALARAALAKGLELLAKSEPEALRWLERAHRLLPGDPNAILSLASACLGSDPARARDLFAEITARYDVRQAWLGLAAARLRLADTEAAAEAVAAALSGHVFDPRTEALANRIGLSGGCAGWCSVTSDGRLVIRVAGDGDVEVSLDGKVLPGSCPPSRHGPARPGHLSRQGAGTGGPDKPGHDGDRAAGHDGAGTGAREITLPDGWSAARHVFVRAGGRELLGSPIRIGPICRVSGCVEVFAGGIRGWAWHPGDPDRPTQLTLEYSQGGVRQTIVASDETIAVSDTGPLAHARSFHLARADLLAVPGPVHVRGPNGKDLLGSPLDPFADQASHIAVALRLAQIYPAEPGSRDRRPAEPDAAGGVLCVDAAAAAEPVGADGRRRATTVVIPVHNGTAAALSCLASVMASGLTQARVLVVDDGSTDAELVAALDRLAKRRDIALLRHAVAQGFTASANAGMRAARGRDVVLLNSDTLVPPGWLDRLRDAAYSARNIGTVTPLSNDATILSYPGEAGTNPVPDQSATARLDRLCERANRGAVIDIPVGIGFCLFLRRDCLNAAGSFRQDVFAQGYGEENDLCLRARMLGWRNVALTGLFVGHVGGTSFGSDAVHLRTRNGKILERLHPGQQALIESFIAADPLAEPRRRIDLLRWRAALRAWRDSVVLITHDHGGGVESRIAAAVRSHEAAGRCAIVLRPARTSGGEAAIAVRNGVADDFSNLVYALPREFPALLRLLRASRSAAVEVHHVLDHPSAIYDLIARLGLPYEVHVHDYAWFCPRLSLVGAHRRYCGEPDEHECESCVEDSGSFLQEAIGVAALRHRSAAFLASAERVVVPSGDTGQRMKRHFAALRPVIVPHDDDALIPPPPPPRPAPNGSARVCVVGAIGLHKGYDVLLACARDAARRNLGLEFIVVGHTTDDARMLATGRVFVTGRFDPAEAVGLIAAQQASLGFVASIWPETWCLSLGELWRAGLRAAAFDIGAPAERIKRSGYGILLPLGLSAGAINNVLIAAAGTAGQ
jgi:GT2 family glycosyltransferase/glycosyltransferase involved in cell wall biosynthesis